MADVVKEFKDFILRGNIVELAVAFVIGVAFAAVVTALVTGLVSPLISMVAGENSLASMSFTINDAEFLYGAVLNQIIVFLATAAVVFFFIVKPMNMFLARRKLEEPTPPPAPELSPEAKRFLEEMTTALQRLS